MSTDERVRRHPPRFGLLPAALAVGLLALLLGWLVLGWKPAPEEVGLDAEPLHRSLDLAGAPTGGEFRLRSASGPVALSDFRGRVVLLYFGYTWCPDICPTNLAIIAYALKQLEPAERSAVQVLFVSVDPARDDPDRLAEYAAYFDPGILGITGTDEQLAEVARRYGAAYRRSEQTDSAMGYLVDHSAFTYLIDPRGRLVETLPHATPAEDIIAAVRRQLGDAGS